MDKDIILEKVKKGGYSQQQLIGWLTCLPQSPEKRKPIEYKQGDVLMHSMFKHPYVLLKKRKNDWICGLLTSEAGCPEILEQCESRFFSENYFTNTLFTTKEISGSFVNVYGNTKHLREVYNKLKNILK
jgi:hypothetical protein